MRELTARERNGMQTPLREYWIKMDGLLPKETRAFEAGFIAGIEYQELEATNLKPDNSAQLAAVTAERDALLKLINEAYEKLGGGHHPYAAGVRDALDYVLRGKDKARRALNRIPQGDTKRSE